MQIGIQEDGEISVIALKGRLDLAGAETVDAFFNGLLKGSVAGRRLLLDFQAVDYISSSGLRVLVQLLKTLQSNGGRLALARMNISVEEVFQFAGLDEVFKIFQGQEDALEFLKGKA